MVSSHWPRCGGARNRRTLAPERQRSTGTSSIERGFYQRLRRAGGSDPVRPIVVTGRWLFLRPARPGNGRMAVDVPDWKSSRCYPPGDLPQKLLPSGLVTRSSTSLPSAGHCTKTSTIGTMIWGSSSRGNFRSNAPSSNEPAITRGVSFELIQACASVPARPSFSVRVMGPLSARHRPKPVGIERSTRGRLFKPGETSTFVFTLAPMVTGVVLNDVFSATKTACSCPRSMTPRRGQSESARAGNRRPLCQTSRRRNSGARKVELHRSGLAAASTDGEDLRNSRWNVLLIRLS